LFYYTKYSDAPDFRDLRNHADDKTVLENPHKGWYLHFIDNGMSRGIYRDDIAEGDFLEYVSGMNNLYLRIDWSDIEKEEGVFDWSSIDRIMSDWGAKGYTFSFRFCTYEGMAHDIPYATPKWVFDRGAKYRRLDANNAARKFPFGFREPISYEPVYDDEIFLHYVELFLAECSRKFNGNPLVEYIDIGTYGTWGEAHTTSGSCTVYPLSSLRKHVDLHLKYFTDTQLFLMYGYITEASNHNQEGITEFIDAYKDKKLGLRCDSVCVGFHFENYLYDTLQAPDLFDIFGKNAPINIENSHQQFTPPERFRDGLTLLEALKNSHATYAGFHGYISEWWPKNQYLHEYLANRLGYWYFIHGAELPDTISEKAELKVHIENRGFSRAFHLYQTSVLLVDENGNSYETACVSPDNRLWEPNRPTVVSVPLSLKNVPVGNYEVYYGLKEGSRPILFGVKAEFCRNGLVSLGNVRVCAP